MISHKAKELPVGRFLYRKDRTKFHPLGVLLRSENGGAGYRLTFRLDGTESQIHASNASKFWEDV